ncbi:MAG: periplasmic heavy metal sensor [Burkholderiales bacterium]|nr:periplasmic heavy metal sensor [Burkholderiales bacterium]
MNENTDRSDAGRTDGTQETPRRRWLKRGALGVLAAGLAGGLGIKAFAHRGDRRGPLDPAELDARIERMLRHLYVEIDATEAQKARLAPIAKQAATDLLPMRERMRAARKEAIGLLTGESIDRAAIERLRSEQLQLAESGSKRLVDAIADAAEVLTPEQRQLIAERIAHRRRRWH